MKKIVYGLMATLSGLVLLFAYRTSLGASVPITSSSSQPAGQAATTGTGTGTTGTGTTGGTGGTATTASATLKDGTFTGSAASTPYGPMQVRITVASGRITAVTVPEYPQGSRRDAEINAVAVPQLVDETLSAQSASVDMVSGATYTSQGYVASLQSALDQATS